MKKVIQNEIRTLLQLQKAGEHRNIIRILNSGWLSTPHNYFYIDMILCDSNLHDYIYDPVRALSGDETSLRRLKNPAYISKGTPDVIMIRNIWTIMGHISEGLEFIHSCGQVHRDVKPRNGKVIFLINTQ